MWQVTYTRILQFQAQFPSLSFSLSGICLLCWWVAQGCRNSSVFRFLIIKINCGKEILKVKGEQSVPIKLIADRVLKSGCKNSNTDLFRVRNLLVGQLLALFLTKWTRVCDFKVVFGTRRLGVICLIKNTFVWPKYNVAFECKQKHLNHVWLIRISLWVCQYVNIISLIGTVIVFGHWAENGRLFGG